MYSKRKRKYISHLQETRRELTKKEYQNLYRLSYDISAELRADVAELLCDHYEEKAEKILLRMTHDVNTMVRLQAVDSLCMGQSNKSVNRLYHLLKARDSLVRAYAGLSLIDVIMKRGNRAEERYYFTILKRCFINEKDSTAKIILGGSLYTKQDAEVFSILMETIHKDIYRNKEKNFWLIMNVFDEIVNDSNKQVIIREIKTMKKVLRNSIHYKILEKEMNRQLALYEKNPLGT